MDKFRYLKVVISLLLLIGMSDILPAQIYKPDWSSLDTRPVPGWYEDAKFGIFIHWGVYSVPAWAPKGSYSEWYQYWLKPGQAIYDHHNAKYGKDFSYYQFAEQFKAEDFNPDQWSRLFEESGAKYVVLTSKHHDGYCLWPSREASRDFNRPWNSMDVGPKRDLAGELTAAVRKTPLKMGFYYSLYEWFNPLWQNDKSRFVSEHFFPQVKDLVSRYKPDILWTDGEWEISDKDWRSEELLSWLYNESPVKNSIVVNDRWGKDTRKKHGGFYTTEYGSDFTASKPWEECRGIGFSFGYNRNEDIEDYNSAQTLILMLVNIVSNGGNLLLDIGPDASGKIPPVMQERLQQIGAWLKVNGEAIYGSRKWKHPYQWSAGNRNWKAKDEGRETGNYILKQTIDPDPGYAIKEAFFTVKAGTVYSILPKRPAERFIINDINPGTDTKITLLGSRMVLKWKKIKNGIEVNLPERIFDDLPCQPAYTLKITGVQN